MFSRGAVVKLCRRRVSWVCIYEQCATFRGHASFRVSCDHDGVVNAVNIKHVEALYELRFRVTNKKLDTS